MKIARARIVKVAFPPDDFTRARQAHNTYTYEYTPVYPVHMYMYIWENRNELSSCTATAAASSCAYTYTCISYAVAARSLVTLCVALNTVRPVVLYRERAPPVN